MENNLDQEEIKKSEMVNSMFLDGSQVPINDPFAKDIVLNPENAQTEQNNVISESSLQLKMIGKVRSTKQLTQASSSFTKHPEAKNSLAISLTTRRQAFSLKDLKKTEVAGGQTTSRRKITKTVTIRNTLKQLTMDSEKKGKDNWKWKLKSFLKKYLDHNVQLMLMSFVTLFALFGPDMKALWLNPYYDPVFNGFFFLIMFMFFSELLASIWVKQGYFKSFFFWLDLFASLSMLLEIDWILFPIVKGLINWNLENGEASNFNIDFLLESKINNKLQVTIRVLRIIRLIRIVKLYKVAFVFYTNSERKKKFEKLKKRKQEKDRAQKRRDDEKKRKEEERRRRENMEEDKKEKRKTLLGFKKSMRKMTSLNNRQKDDDIPVEPKDTGMAKDSEEPSMLMPRPTIMGMLEGSSTYTLDAHQALLNFHKQKSLMEEKEEDMIEINLESNISKATSESITQKVIFIILLMLIIAPITDNEVYTSDENLSFIILCKYINNFVVVYGSERTEYSDLMEQFIFQNSDDYYPIIKITYNQTELWNNVSISDNTTLYREDEKSYAYSPEGLTQIEFSNKKYTTSSAWLNILRTCFIICILFYMAVMLERDVKGFVLKPLEAMIDLVDSVAKDPINMKNIENLKNKLKKSSLPKQKNSVRHSSSSGSNGISNQNEVEGVEYEMKVIQMAIIKISALLAIGFGEAGGEILRENISSQEGLNPMIAGKKKCAIFGFCDIRHFADINVALQEKTMVFVNEIADIVHSCVDKFGGSANKNIGDAFLIVWKFPHLEKTMENEDADIDPLVELKKADHKLNSDIADRAVLGYLNIIKKINKSPTILAYKNNSEIRAKFGDKFKVQMGFGLHYGWGIEGPIGSFYKIDCSYLSPNVNISARLEAATRQYGVSILISGELYDLLSPELKNICRIIDIVTVKGSKTPIRLYTIYVNHNLKPGRKKPEMSLREKQKYYMNKKEKLKSDVQKMKNGSVGKFVLAKKGFKEMLTDKKRPLLFYDKFQEGFTNYIDGNWEKAYYKFKDALFLDSTDGPTKTLFNYIKERNKTAPDIWEKEKCRELTNK